MRHRINHGLSTYGIGANDAHVRSHKYLTLVVWPV